MQSADWVRAYEGGRLRRVKPSNYQLRPNERHDSRGVLTPKTGHGRGSISGEKHKASEQSQLAWQRASERDYFERKSAAHAAIESLGAAHTHCSRSSLKPRPRLVDYDSDTSIEDPQEVEARAKRSRRRARRMENIRTTVAARAAAAVVTAATLAAPTDSAVASAVVAAAEKAVFSAKDRVLSHSDQAIVAAEKAAFSAKDRVLSHSGQAIPVCQPQPLAVSPKAPAKTKRMIQSKRMLNWMISPSDPSDPSDQTGPVGSPQLPAVSRPAHSDRQPIAGTSSAFQESHKEKASHSQPSREDSTTGKLVTDDLAASIDNAIASLNEDIAKHSAYMNVLDASFAKSEKKLAEMEKARAEQFCIIARAEKNSSSAAMAKEIAEEYEERLRKAYHRVRSENQNLHEHQVAGRTAATVVSRDVEDSPGIRGVTDQVAGVHLPGVKFPAGNLGKNAAGEMSGLEERTVDVVNIVHPSELRLAEEAATVPRRGPVPNNLRRIPPLTENVPIYPWNAPTILERLD